MSFWVLSQFLFCHNLNFWVLSQFEFLSFVTIWVFGFVTIWVFLVSSQLHFWSFIAIYLFEFHHNLSFWVSSHGLRCSVCLLMKTVYWILINDFCENLFANQFFLVHTFFCIFFKKLNFKYTKNPLKMTSPTVLVPWLQYSPQSSDWSLVYSLLQDSGFFLIFSE